MLYAAFRKTALSVAAFVAASLLASGAMASGNEGMTGHELAVKMDNVDTSKDSYSEAVMTIHRGGKTLTRSFKTYSKHVTGPGNSDDEYSLMIFDKPAEVNGTKYLVWSYEGVGKDDDMWIYLPAESIVRRISGSSKFASFMRSDLSNEDVQNMDDVEEYTYKLHGSETVNGIDCWILERDPKPGKDTDYSKQIQWVRKDNYLRLKSDYYNKKGQLVKKFFFLENKVIDGIPTCVKMKVEHPEEGTYTVIEWPVLKYNVGLADSWFEHSQLKR